VAPGCENAAVDVDSPTLARPRALDVSTARFRTLALVTLALLWLIVATGAAVRLTASGLGCESWPGCSEGSPFPARDHHAFVEFGHRLIGALTILSTALTALGAWFTRALPRWAAWLAVALFAGTVAQAPLGALTVAFHLHPLLVMPHLLLSIAVLGAAVVLAFEAVALDRGHGVPFARDSRRLALALVVGGFALVVSGAFATAAGPHSGGEDVARFGSFDVALYAHAATVGVFGSALVFVVGYLFARRAEAPLLFRGALALVALVLVQMGIGELQYRAELPWWLVLVHVAVAASVWVGVVALATQLWRPLAGLAPGPARVH
jgi:cytochrome c oxidase assembly protein subunit 15